MTAKGLDDRREWVLSVLEQYEAPLTRFAGRLLRDEETARDVVQHVFLQLCDQTAEDLHPRLAQWLFTVCRNKAIDVLRSRGRTASLAEQGVPACVSNEPDPAAMAQRNEVYDRISDLLGRLAAGQRETVLLWSEGFSYREIARITGHREGNVRVLVHRAIKQLRRQPEIHRLLDPETESICEPTENV